MRAIVVLSLALLLGAAPPATAEAPPPDLDVIVNAESSVTRLSLSEIAEIFNGSRASWGGGRPIIAFNLRPSHPLRVEFDRVVLHMSPEEIGRFWIDQRIRGGTRPPRQVDDQDLVVKLVAKLPGAIAYALPAATHLAGVRVVARIRNHRVEE